MQLKTIPGVSEWNFFYPLPIISQIPRTPMYHPLINLFKMSWIEFIYTINYPTVCPIRYNNWKSFN